MVIFAASRCLFHFRVHLASSWAKREYYSSGPVRYVLWSHNHTKNDQKTPPLESLEKNEASSAGSRRLKGGKDTQKASRFEDEVFQDSYFSTEFVESSNLFKQVELSEANGASDPDVDLLGCDIETESELLLDESLGPSFNDNMITEKDEVKDSNIKQDAERTAIELLAARGFTVVELRKKLHGKKYSLPIVDSVIADMKRRGLLNDGLYAESFSRSRWLSSHWGPRRIKQALVQKGVSKVEADKAAKQVFEDDDLSGNGGGTQFGMSKLSMDRLFLQASKQWHRGGQEISLENRKSRIVRWLQYRGFDRSVTSCILKKLQSQFPT